MQTYSPILLLLLVISGCSSPNQKNVAKTTIAKAADSANRDSTAIPDSSGTARKPLDSAALDLEIANESTLSPSKGGLTFPPYGLDKVQAAIVKMRHIENDSLRDPLHAHCPHRGDFCHHQFRCDGTSTDTPQVTCRVSSLRIVK